MKQIERLKNVVTCSICTVRNEVAKVMFLHLSVCPQGVCLSACWNTSSPPGADPHPVSRHTAPRSRSPPPTDGYCCGTHPTGMHSCLSVIGVECMCCRHTPFTPFRERGVSVFLSCSAKIDHEDFGFKCDSTDVWFHHPLFQCSGSIEVPLDLSSGTLLFFYPENCENQSAFNVNENSVVF